MPYFTYDSNLRDRNKFTSSVNTTFGTRRYFSSLDTEVYFGSEQIDEMVALDYTIHEDKMPIYGYNSFYANRIVPGRRTVQGTFAINFTSTTYLLEKLQSIEDSILQAGYYTEDGTYLAYETTVFRCEGEDSTGLGIGNNAIFNKMFDITVSYGYGKTEGMQTLNSCYQTLVGVQITDYRQALDTEGNPILDMYSFIAKDIRYADAVAGSETSTNNTQKKDDVQDQQILPDYLVANRNIQSEVNNLQNRCKNSTLAGFIVNPKFKRENGLNSITLSIDSVNNPTEKFTNVVVTITDQLNKINFSCSMKDIYKGSTSTFTLNDANLSIGYTLQEQFEKTKGYNPICTVEFMAEIEGVDTDIKYETSLFKN